MTVINQQLPATGNAYLLFGFEAIQARPNLDPYTSALRTNDETMQVMLSDVHLKHHVRRGLKVEAGKTVTVEYMAKSAAAPAVKAAAAPAAKAAPAPAAKVAK